MHILKAIHDEKATMTRSGWSALCVIESIILTRGVIPQVIQRLGFEDSSVAKTARAQARVLAFNYWLTYCILKAKKPSFQRMEPVVGRTI